MSERYSIAEARTNLPNLVREAEAGKTVELTRRGESVAVLMGRKEYERLVSRTRTFSQAWEAFAADVDLAAAAIDPDEVFANVRSTDEGRDPGL
jgi:prevent-host-death family protein